VLEQVAELPLGEQLPGPAVAERGGQCRSTARSRRLVITAPHSGGNCNQYHRDCRQNPPRLWRSCVIGSGWLRLRVVVRGRFGELRSSRIAPRRHCPDGSRGADLRRRHPTRAPHAVGESRLLDP
jgi:hypothetical protein